MNAVKSCFADSIYPDLFRFTTPSTPCHSEGRSLAEEFLRSLTRRHR